MKKHVLPLIILLTAVACQTEVKNTDSCGDGILDPDEQCDGDVLGATDCQQLGYYQQFGLLTCLPDCSLDVSVCTGRCGDLLVQGEFEEECDGTLEDTCVSLGYHDGALLCDAQCELDLSGCEVHGRCGDGAVDAGFEACDGSDLDGQDCLTLGYYAGELACADDCATLDESGCEGRCGDGIMDSADGETCDDGDTDEGDGCTGACRPDDGWTCYGEPSTCIQVVQVSGGLYHNCARLSDGTVRCWGRNNYGQLGDGTNTDAWRPVQVSGLTGAVDLDCGWNHTCAVLADGTVRCWGENGLGSLGDGTTTASLLPVPVSGLTSAVQVTLGSGFTCARLSDGTARCWGRNNSGNLGTTYKDAEPCMDGPTPIDCARAPAVVDGLAGATRLEAGGGHTCALVDGGQVRCWGINNLGQVGDGTMTNRFAPAAVVGTSGSTITGMLHLGAGWGHSCASDGALVRCWGRNDFYQLGTGNTSTLTRASDGLSLAAVGLTLGHQFSCAVLANGLTCWGANQRGQLGIGNFDGSKSVPTPATSILALAAIGSHSDGSCAVRSSGEAVCWGFNMFGQLGNGTTTDSAFPVPVQW